jgi:sugar O-acyltransferase (sialic acid O-acetyltransferase NeuD family)
MYLFGASGHGKVIADIALSHNIIIKAFIDQDIKKKICYGIPVLHSLPQDDIPLIISIGDCLTRKKISIELRNRFFGKLVHKHAVLSSTVSVNFGTVVMPGVCVNADTYIGRHVIINTNSSVDHECHIEDFVHISPNVALAGNVYIGEGTHIGIGTCVIQGVKIGKWCVIGAGTVIINDIPDYSVVVGNPGRIIKKNKIE